MELLSISLKIIICLGIFNVWILRRNKKTRYRGSKAINLKEEFKEYGLSEPLFFIIFGLKISSAVLIFSSIWISPLKIIGISILASLMVGALICHKKVNDEVVKSIPAISILILCLLLIKI